MLDFRVQKRRRGNRNKNRRHYTLVAFDCIQNFGESRKDPALTMHQGCSALAIEPASIHAPVLRLFCADQAALCWSAVVFDSCLVELHSLLASQAAHA